MSADEKQLLLTLIDEVKSLKRKLELTNKPSYTNEDVLKIFGISRPTLQKWRKKWMITDRIKAVTLDRALKEMIFKKKEQIQCFEYLQELFL